MLEIGYLIYLLQLSVTLVNLYDAFQKWVAVSVIQIDVRQKLRVTVVEEIFGSKGKKKTLGN